RSLEAIFSNAKLLESPPPLPLGRGRPARSRSRRLADLLLQALAGVADSLVFVRIRRAQAPNFRRDLAYLLAVRAAHNNVCQLIQDRKSTRLNSSHVSMSYAVFCLTKKNADAA